MDLELEKRISTLENKECCCGHSKIILSGDGPIRIPGGVAVDMIRIKSISVLAALTIGTTPGGTDVLDSSTTVSGWNLFKFITDAFNESDYKLYFGGITSTSTIIIYKR